MEAVKEWTQAVCVILIICTIIKVFIPKDSLGSLSKIILSVFMAVSIITPVVNRDVKIDFPNTQFSENYTENESDIYKSSIENQIKKYLAEKGVENAHIQCEITLKNSEITVNSITVTVTDEYDRESIKNMIQKDLGYVSEVNYIGE